MANNIKPGYNSVIPHTSGLFSDLGITSLNTTRITRTNGTELKSFRPDSLINPIQGFEVGFNYQFIAKLAQDLTANVSPPLPAGTSSPNALVDFDDSEIIDNP